MQLFSTYLDSLVQRFWIKDHTTNITENNKIIHSKGLFAMCTCVVAHNGIISSIAVAVISASATRARAHQQTAENILTGILLLISFFLSLFYLFALPLVVILLLHFSLALHAFHENTRCIFFSIFLHWILLWKLTTNSGGSCGDGGNALESHPLKYWPMYYL